MPMQKKMQGKRSDQGVLVILSLALWSIACLVPAAQAADYEVDPAHSFVQFRIQHLGFSWLYGRFNRIAGDFAYDPADPSASQIGIEIDTASVDTNHAERDKHLREEDFLDVKRYPRAVFESTKYTGTAEEGTLEGVLTLHGVSKPISLAVKKIGEGPDPWGGYRAGFLGSFTLSRGDFGIDYDLGPAGETVEMELGIEGIRK
jgi:polyisoprenoid-binding protein YceI